MGSKRNGKDSEEHTTLEERQSHWLL